MVKKAVPQNIGSTNFFYAGFTGTLGSIAASIVYGFYLLVLVALTILGYYLMVRAQQCKTVPVGTNVLYVRNGQSVVQPKIEKNCTKFNDMNISYKLEYISGAILLIVFGFLLLIYIFPFVLSGLARGAAEGFTKSMFK